MALEPTATHRIGHVSDTHFTASGVLHDIPTAPALAAALDALEQLPIDALVHTGDIADAGEPAAYAAVRSALVTVTERTGWPVAWAVGNHDLRGPLREHLLGLPPTDEPLDTVQEVRGLRLVTVDTSIPGRVEGGLEDAQLEWLRSVLTQPAEHGSVLALHHPPLPVEVTAMARLHLTGQDRLAAVLDGTDVRAVLGGHLHYSTASVLAGVPVFTVPALAYTIRLTAPGTGVTGADGGRAVGVLSLYDDGRVGHSLVATDPAPIAARTPEEDFLSIGVDE
jgi:3',5'-cyclic AMP phosphodiesterase CpdA